MIFRFRYFRFVVIYVSNVTNVPNVIYVPNVSNVIYVTYVFSIIPILYMSRFVHACFLRSAKSQA